MSSSEDEDELEVVGMDSEEGEGEGEKGDKEKIVKGGDGRGSKNSSACGKKTLTPGVLYLSRIPPFMRPRKVRHLLSQYGGIGRVYLQPEGETNVRASPLLLVCVLFGQILKFV